MVFVCSDIHGNYEVYMKIVNKLTKNDKLYIIGDVIDRNSDGISILLDIKKRSNVELLIGNHEWMMLLASMGLEKYASMWLIPQNGGQITCKSMLEYPNDIITDLLDWMETLKVYKCLTINNKRYHLVHGLWSTSLTEDMTVKPNDYAVEDALWEAPLKGSSTQEYIKSDYYIHGHVPVIRFTPFVEPLEFDNIINIDGGLTYGGGLILYCLDNNSYEVFTNG